MLKRLNNFSSVFLWLRRLEKGKFNHIISAYTPPLARRESYGVLDESRRAGTGCECARDPHEPASAVEEERGVRAAGL
jgi:hypothetical protein